MIDRSLEKSLALCRRSGGRQLTLPAGLALDRFDWRQLLERILHDFPQLAKLDFTTAQLDEPELARFLRKSNLHALAEISLAMTPVSNLAASALADSITAGILPNLVDISLQDTFITDAGFDALAGAANAGCMRALQCLDISRSLITDVGLSSFARAIERSRMPNLTLLYLDGTPITERGFTALIGAAKAGQLKNLQRLSLSDKQITANSMKRLKTAVTAGELSALHAIEFCLSNPAKVKIVARAVEEGELGFLENIELYVDAFSGRYSHLSSFARRTTIGDRYSIMNLLAVCAANTRSQISGLIYTLLHGSPLKRLWHTIIYGADTHVTIEALIRALHSGRLQNLTVLAICHLGLTDDELSGIAHAIDAGKATTLKSFLAFNTRVTDGFMRVLCHAAEGGNLKHLRSLSLYGSEITEAGLRFLSDAFEAGGLPQLKDIDIRKTAVSVDTALLESCRADEICEWLRRPPDGCCEVPLREAKLIVLGQGGSGKTAVCARVLLGSKSFPETPGSPLQQQEGDNSDTHVYELVLGQGSGRVTFRLWDFGGQDHLRGTHRFVVGAERALYLLVVDAAQSAKANRLDYWLRFLAHYGSLEVSGQMSRAPVIVVRTKCDKVSHNTADRTSVENAAYVGRGASDLTAALEIARENEWYGANVVEVIDDVGYPQSEYSVAGTTCQDADSAERLRSAICEHTKSVVGINNRVPAYALKIRDWIKEHFEAPVFSDTLAHFQYDKPPFVDFLRSEGLDRDKSGRTHSESGSSLLDLRVPATLTLLKSLGVIHWNGDMAEAAPNPDSVLFRRVFNPRWIKTPVSRLISLPAVDYPNGWIDRSRLETKLLPVRKPATNARHPGNDSEWFEQLGLSSEERGQIVEIMTDYGIAFPIATSREQGILVPDCLSNVDVAWNPSPEMIAAEYRSDFLSDRMLLQFLAHQVERAMSTDCEIPRGLARNWAKLTWDEAGTAFDVLIHIDLCPPSGEPPRLRIAVGGGLPEGRARVLAAVRKEIELVLAANKLPPIEETQPKIGGSVSITRALRKPRRRFDPEIADIRVRNYLDRHPHASAKVVAAAAAIAVGQLSQLRSWKERRGRQRGENRKTARPDRQLSDKQFAVLGERDSGYEQIEELESFCNWLRKQYKTAAEQERLAGMPKDKLLLMLEETKSQMIERGEEFPWAGF